MLTLKNVNVLENAPQPQGRDIADWPLLDSRGNSLDDLGSSKPRKAKKPAVETEKNKLPWRGQTPETDTDEEDRRPRPPPVDELEYSDEDDLDGEEEEMEAAINFKNRAGNTERNYMYPEHDPAKQDPAKPPMLKFKASLFSRNVLVVNKALKQLLNKNKDEEMEDEHEDKRMPRRAEGRVQSSKRRQQMSLRNQYTELTVNYDEVLKENKLLKQIQKRQERELDRFNNNDEDLPRLLDANNYEIAGLKVKNKQLLFEKREQDDKLRRQHQEIVSLKEQQKKLSTLINNKKLGDREKLEVDLTTARVTIAHQENKIQDLTKAVEIYKKTADREVRTNTLQLKKSQNNLRELQDAYNELFIKYKAKEKELGNQYIYTQNRGRVSSKRSNFRSGLSQPNLTLQSFNTTKNSTPAPAESKYVPKETKSTPNIKPSSSLERLESELEELNRQSDSLADLEKVLEEENKESNNKTTLNIPKPRSKSISTLGSDSEEDLDEDLDSEPTPNQITPRKEGAPPKPSPRTTEPDTAEMERRKREEEARVARESEENRRREEETRRAAEAAEREAAEKRRQEERAKEGEAGRRKKEAEERAAKEEEERLLNEKKKKDDDLKEKLAAVRKNAGGGGDFMSQLKAKRHTPSISPSHSVKSTEAAKSPPAVAAVDRTAKKSGSGDDLRKTAALNNINSRRKKSVDEDVGYQPSFAPASPKVNPAKNDPFGVEINRGSGEYTPSFSNNQRISRENVNNNKQVWTPTGRASTSERNGLFDSKNHDKHLKRRPSKTKNVIPVKTYSQDDDLEELML